MIRRSLIIGWIVTAAGLHVLLAGQNPPTQAPSTQNAPAQSSLDESARTAPAAALSALAGMQGDDTERQSTLPQIPGLLGGTGISPAFLSESERSNYLRGGVNVGATYDSNPLL